MDPGHYLVGYQPMAQDRAAAQRYSYNQYAAQQHVQQVDHRLTSQQAQPQQPVYMEQVQQSLTPAQSPAIAVPAYLQEFYEVIGKIGEGTYGVVYLARSKEAQSRLLAVKTFKTGREGDGVSLTAIREIMLLTELNHCNIVRLDSVHINRQDPCLSLAFDYAEHDLYEMIRYHREKLFSAPFDLYTLKSVTWQLLNGLSYLHQNWILHRDLKPSNILVMGEGEEQGCVKVADFGLARVYRAPLRPLSDNGVVVTIWYRSPELLLGAKHYTPAIDMWASGCIIAELMTLRPLFQGEERKQPSTAFQADQLDKIFRIMGHPSPNMWPDIEHLPHWRDNTENVRVRNNDQTTKQLDEFILAHCHMKGLHKGCALLSLLSDLLEYDPKKRITAAQALEHPFFKEEPLPGMNSFVHRGRAVAMYPRRTKYDPKTPSEPVPQSGQAVVDKTAANQGPMVGNSGVVGQMHRGPHVSPFAGGTVAGGPKAGVPVSGNVAARMVAAQNAARKRKNDWGPGFR